MPSSGPREARMQAFVDVCWAELGTKGVSWIGFYLGPGETHDDGRVVGPKEMLLGPRRDKPACSPIGLHGCCGRSWLTRQTLVVRDVAVMGPNYVACDPRDLSELVIPLFDERGACWGVLDVDSFDLASFDEHDAHALQSLLHRAGLTGRRETPEIVVL